MQGFRTNRIKQEVIRLLSRALVVYFQRTLLPLDDFRSQKQKLFDYRMLCLLVKKD